MLEAAAEGDQGGYFEGGEEAVTGGAVVEEDDVAGLFAAKDAAGSEHFFENVAVADVGAGEGDAFA